MSTSILGILTCPNNIPNTASGGTFITLFGAPSTSIGAPGDYALDKNTGRLYVRAVSNWVFDYQFSTPLTAFELLSTNSGTLDSINWATDMPAGKTETWHDIFGDYPVIVEEDQNDNGTWSPNGTPSYVWNADRSILSFSPQVLVARFIITT